MKPILMDGGSLEQLRGNAVRDRLLSRVFRRNERGAVPAPIAHRFVARLDRLITLLTEEGADSPAVEELFKEVRDEFGNCRHLDALLKEIDCLRRSKAG